MRQCNKSNKIVELRQFKGSRRFEIFVTQRNMSIFHFHERSAIAEMIHFVVVFSELD